MVKPRWLREQEKNLKREFRVDSTSDFPINYAKVTKITDIDIDPEKEAKTLLQRILEKFKK